MIVDARHVLTVAHVLDADDGIVVDAWLPARVVGRRAHPTDSGEDGLVLLELVRGEFPPDRVAKLAAKPGRGVVYLAARGEVPWPWRIEPGDSGSPILDADGRVTGLVRAVYGRAEPLDEKSVAVMARP